MIVQTISFETAQLAKEKGFDWSVEWAYQLRDNVPFSVHDSKDREEVDYNKDDNVECSQPSQPLLQKWLREEHKIILLCHITVGVNKYNWWMCDNKKTDAIASSYPSKEFDLYEDALEVGLFEALKLI